MPANGRWDLIQRLKVNVLLIYNVHLVGITTVYADIKNVQNGHL